MDKKREELWARLDRVNERLDQAYEDLDIAYDSVMCNWDARVEQLSQEIKALVLRRWQIAKELRACQ